MKANGSQTSNLHSIILDLPSVHDLNSSSNAKLKKQIQGAQKKPNPQHSLSLTKPPQSSSSSRVINAKNLKNKVLL